MSKLLTKTVENSNSYIHGTFNTQNKPANPLFLCILLQSTEQAMHDHVQCGWILKKATTNTLVGNTLHAITIVIYY